MTGEQKFMLVWFEDDVGMTRSIDIVPANWIVYDDTVDHLVTPFISECSKANLRILSDLVKSEGKPPLSWTKHRISIKGSAKTYAEAERKLKDLETRDHVFTTDNENHAAAREENLVKKYKLKGNKFESHDIQAKLAACAFEVPQKEITGRNIVRNKKIVSTKKKLLVSPKKKQISPKNKQISLKKKISPRIKQHKTKQFQIVESDSESSSNVDSEESALERSSDDDISKVVEHKQGVAEVTAVRLISTGRDMRENEEKNRLSDRSDFESPIASGTECQLNDTRFTRKPAAKSVAPDVSRQGADTRNHKAVSSIPPTGNSDISDSDDVKTIVLDCYRRLSAQIGQLQSVVADIRMRQTEIVSGIGTNTTKDITGIDSTMKKYNLGELPLKTMSDFEEFDKNLKENKSIRKEMISGMSALISSESKYLIRSARNIMQRFMSRDLILMFTAVRQSGGKKIFKTETTFYICIRDAILTECKNDTSVKEKNIQEAIGSVINNAKDWEGHRQNRAKKQPSAP